MSSARRDGPSAEEDECSAREESRRRRRSESPRRSLGGGRDGSNARHSFDNTRSFALRPLVEMGVVGACRRGRRRGRRNRTATERESEMEQRRCSKNARERERVENVRNEYAKLQKLLDLESEELDASSKERRQFCKLRTLTAAIERIKTLTELLRSDDAETRSVAASPRDQTVDISEAQSLGYAQNYDHSYMNYSQADKRLLPPTTLSQPSTQPVFSQDFASPSSAEYQPQPYQSFSSHPGFLPHTSPPHSHTPHFFYPSLYPYGLPAPPGESWAPLFPPYRSTPQVLHTFSQT